MSKLQKIAFALITVLIFAGSGFAFYATFNPDGVEQFFNVRQIEFLIPIFFISMMFVIMGLAFSPLIINFFKKMKLKKHLMAVGVPGVGTVVAVQDTGITINNNPFIKMEIEVKPGIHTVISATVSRVDIPRAGDQFKILYDPSKPTDAILSSQ